MRFLVSLLTLCMMAWAGAVLWFIQQMPTETLSPDKKADALVVITGGGARVEHGLDMLAQGVAPVLFISGVGNHGDNVTINRILTQHGKPEIRKLIAQNNPEIVLDMIAKDTINNAEQTRVFAEKRHLNSIRLVTADYHMQRALHEFHDAMPGITIMPDPVFPAEYHRATWWQHENTRRLLFTEFHKYLFVLLRDSLRPNVANG